MTVKLINIILTGVATYTLYASIQQHVCEGLASSSSDSNPSNSSRSTTRQSSRVRRSYEPADELSSGPKARSASTSRRQYRLPDRENSQVIFTPKLLTSTQSPNLNAPCIHLINSPPSSLSPAECSLRIRTSSVIQIPSKLSSMQSISTTSDTTALLFNNGPPITNHPHFQYISLDELFPSVPNFSSIFHTNSQFRESLRYSIRHDIFHSTPAYKNLSTKVSSMMLSDDSSLQGSWNVNDQLYSVEKGLRMSRLTAVLRETLGDCAPNGDEFIMTIGALCGSKPSTHWIDIIGVKDRFVTHSWHQDTGLSYSLDDISEDGSKTPKSCYTVMWGFPAENEYYGTGVFSHIVKLSSEHLAPPGHNLNEPVLFEGKVSEEFIVRPDFGLGKEFIRYRDVDVLHSAPDVAYRSSVMRFM